jgi:hypothetical protein
MVADTIRAMDEAIHVIPIISEHNNKEK